MPAIAKGMRFSSKNNIKFEKKKIIHVPNEDISTLFIYFLKKFIPLCAVEENYTKTENTTMLLIFSKDIVIIVVVVVLVVSPSLKVQVLVPTTNRRLGTESKSYPGPKKKTEGTVVVGGMMHHTSI